MYLSSGKSVTQRVWLDCYADSLDSAAAALDPCNEPGRVRLGNGAVGAAAARAQRRTAVQQPPCGLVQPLHGGKLGVRISSHCRVVCSSDSGRKGTVLVPEDPRGGRRRASRECGRGQGGNGRRFDSLIPRDLMPSELALQVLGPGSAEFPDMFCSELPDCCLRLYQGNDMGCERIA